MRRALPAVGLFFLSPLVAEYLLGNLPITFLGALVLLAPLYGGGAILIRETARRAGRGWPTILLLAVAYGVLEEGITTMSLFNPNYANAHLLDKGFIPALGIALPWTVGVLTMHAVWSIGVPIALVEELTGPRRTDPWLGPAGLAIAGVLFVLGVVGNTAFSIATYQFVASAPQLAGATVAILVLVALALRLPPLPRRPLASGRAPSPWLVGLLSLAATSAAKWLPSEWPAWLVVLLILAMDAAAIGLVYYWSRLPGWNGEQRVALAGGALLTYAWSAFPQTPVLPVSPTADLVGNAIFAAGAVALLGVAALRVRSRERSEGAAGEAAGAGDVADRPLSRDPAA